MTDFKLAGIVSAVGLGLGYLLGRPSSKVMESAQGNMDFEFVEVAEYHDASKNSHKYYAIVYADGEIYSVYGRLPNWGREMTVSIIGPQHSAFTSARNFKKKLQKGYQKVPIDFNNPKKANKMATKIYNKIREKFPPKSEPKQLSEPKQEEPKKPVNARLAMAMKRRQMMGAEGLNFSTNCLNCGNQYQVMDKKDHVKLVCYDCSDYIKLPKSHLSDSNKRELIMIQEGFKENEKNEAFHKKYPHGMMAEGLNFSTNCLNCGNQYQVMDKKDHVKLVCYDCSDYIKLPKSHLSDSNKKELIMIQEGFKENEKNEAFHKKYPHGMMAEGTLYTAGKWRRPVKFRHLDDKNYDGAIELQGYGFSPAKLGENLQIGDVLVWNNGYKSRILDIQPKGKQSLVLKTMTQDTRYKKGEEFERTIRKNRLVGVAQDFHKFNGVMIGDLPPVAGQPQPQNARLAMAMKRRQMMKADQALLLDEEDDGELMAAEYQPNQELGDYSVSEIAKSSAIEGYQPNKYSFGPISLGAESVSSLKLKKDSCCCGATKKTPCVCMVLGSDCSAKKPMCACYRLKAIQEKDKKAAETNDSDSMPIINPKHKTDAFKWIKKEGRHIKSDADKEMDEYDYTAMTFLPEELESGAVNALNAGDLEAAQTFVKALNRQNFIKAYQAEKNR